MHVRTAEVNKFLLLNNAQAEGKGIIWNSWVAKQLVNLLTWTNYYYKEYSLLLHYTLFTQFLYLIIVYT